MNLHELHRLLSRYHSYCSRSMWQDYFLASCRWRKLDYFLDIVRVALSSPFFFSPPPDLGQRRLLYLLDFVQVALFAPLPLHLAWRRLDYFIGFVQVALSSFFLTSPSSSSSSFSSSSSSSPASSPAAARRLFVLRPVVSILVEYLLEAPTCLLAIVLVPTDFHITCLSLVIPQPHGVSHHLLISRHPSAAWNCTSPAYFPSSQCRAEFQITCSFPVNINMILGSSSSTCFWVTL